MAGPGSTAPSSSGSWMASWISSSQITTGSTGSDTLCDIVCSDFLAAEEVFQKLLNPLLQINLRYGITVHCHPCTPRATAQLKACARPPAVRPRVLQALQLCRRCRCG